MPRFFLPSEALASGAAVFSGEDARHISGALRMRPGDTLTVCDGKGMDYRCVLTDVSPQRVTAKVAETAPSAAEPGMKVTLFAALPKGDKLELVIQKAVELGAIRIVPFLSERSVSRPDKEKAEAKAKRWQKIADEAAKQSGRGILPEISPPVSFADALKEAAGCGLKLFLYENEQETGLREAFSGKIPSSAAVMTGPEGGFAPEEAEAARAAGFVSVSLGRRILRCETAPIAALCVLLFHAGDFDPS